MQARSIVTAKDFPALQSFWLAKGLPEVPLAAVPEHGIVVTDKHAVSGEELIICGAYLIASDVGIASIAYIASNPGFVKSIRSEALNLLVRELIKLARELGCNLIAAATNVDALKIRYENLGLTKTDENVTHYIGRV